MSTSARHLVAVDAPRVVIGRDVGLSVTVVSVEVAERAASLLDDLDAEGPVVFDVPAKPVAVVDVELASDASGDVCLGPRHRTLGVDALAAHRRIEGVTVDKP